MQQQILQGITSLKRQILPHEKMFLYGSQARGDSQADSDWDLLILLNKEKRDFEDFDIYAYPFAEFGLKNDVLIMAKVFTMKDWERQKPSLFYKNVERDKIEIV